ncbi:MAG: 30S ribosomal protein S17 [Deltaproteobacteria bacterium]|nr:30S ribosomal protein S17 [Deltaproteobacteria bacterium]MBM4316031.1 30S ribosomal protein S17 [Deltaproteobacteria bacterium]
MTSSENKQDRRQVVRGVVVSDKMTKTRVIELKRTQNHRLYHKKLIHQKRLFIHDEKNESKIGDVVMAESTRPLSRHKAFRLIKIVEKRVAE